MEISALYGLLEKVAPIGIKGGIARYDSDLILFCRSGGGVLSKGGDELRIIGGRSAEPFSALSLSEHLELTKAEYKYMCEALYDSGISFVLLAEKNKTVLIFNRLFRSCGLGAAVVFNVTPKLAAYAISKELFYGLSDIGYSKKLLDLSAKPSDEGLEREAVAFSDSVFDAAHRLMATIGLGPMAAGSSESDRLYSVISAASDVTGSTFELKSFCPPDADNRSSRDSLASFLLCSFSLCRKLAERRSGELEVLKRRSGITTLKLRFELYDGEGIDEISMSCIRFCEAMAQRLEAPLSFDLNGRECEIEFAPLRSDPSLSGLKAGVRFNEEYIG